MHRFPDLFRTQGDAANGTDTALGNLLAYIQERRTATKSAVERDVERVFQEAFDDRLGSTHEYGNQLHRCVALCSSRTNQTRPCTTAAQVTDRSGGENGVVVDEDINLSKGLDGRADGLVDAGVIRHVHLNRQRPDVSGGTRAPSR